MCPYKTLYLPILALATLHFKCPRPCPGNLHPRAWPDTHLSLVPVHCRGQGMGP